MREIRFRGKRTDNGGWAYGDLVRYYENQRRFIAYDQLAYMYKECGIDRLVSERFFEVNPDTVGQYTGLRDMNGREIYEGDIIFFEPFGTHNNDRIVKFEQGCFVGELIRNGYSQTLSSTDLFKIIGHIHENTELLEAVE